MRDIQPSLSERRPTLPRRVPRPWSLPHIAYPPALPITARKDEIVQAIREHQVVVITGETGSGKTTQIPKMCLEAGRGRGGMIGCTQPRRVAAVTVARRIAEEFGEELGHSVAYKIRFDERRGSSSLIKIMTDGILLMEARSDRRLSAYDTIIVDEAHERNLNIDFVLGILRRLVAARRDLKVIITSATIDAETFSRAFDGAPIIEVSGRLYPVEVRWRPLREEPEEDNGNHIDAAAAALTELVDACQAGDVLIFMPTEQDIRETCELIRAQHGNELEVMPMFARLSWDEQQRVFRPTPRRKVIVATNIAETSLTIPGIRYVIDTGLARLSRYNPRSRTKSLPVEPISRSSADQRKGRCGRVRNGICIRIYSEEDYACRPLFTPPEILRANLAEVILRMLSLGLGDIASFPFVDPPPAKSIHDGIEILQELGAVVSRHGALALTPIGRRMAQLPIDPRIARMIIEAEKENCVEDVAVIAAALSTTDPRERPTEAEAEAKAAQAVFADPASDFVTILNMWRQSHSLAVQESRGKLRRFCREHFLSYRRMREWQDIYEQLLAILAEQGWQPERADKAAPAGADAYGRIHRAILSGFLSQIGHKKEKNFYEATKGREVMIFPGSSIFNKGGQWIVAAEMVQTSRLFARTAATIDVAWLEQLGGNFCRSTYSEPHWSRARGEVVAYEQVSLFGLVIVPRRLVSFGHIDPEAASRIFIQSALIEGDIARPLPFLVHNQQLRERIAAMEDKLRRRVLLVDDEVLQRFYEERLPGIADVRTLQKFIRDRGGDSFLRLREEDLLLTEPDREELAHYPDEISAGRCRLRVTYCFAPGMESDGATVRIPVDAVGSVPPAALERAVPGLYRERIAALLKGLPKSYRKQLLPLAETVNTIVRELPEEEMNLLSILGRFIYTRFGVDIPATAWLCESLPEHLRLRFAVIDEEGRELKTGRDFSSIRTTLVEAAASESLARARAAWERTGLKTWDFGELPDVIPLQQGEIFHGYAYPALVPEHEGVALRLLSDEAEARLLHPRGVAALFAQHLAPELRQLKKALTPRDAELKTWAASFGPPGALSTAIVDAVVQELFTADIRTQESFASLAEQRQREILPRGQELLRASLPVFKAYHEALTKLAALRFSHRESRPALQYLEELRGELASLVPADFPSRTPPERLPHLVRYVKALIVRAERGLTHLEKAWRKEEEVKVFVTTLAELLKNTPPGASAQKRAAIAELAWMVEEYKVSLFAQELKTAFPISKKRLEEKIAEIQRMA